MRDALSRRRRSFDGRRLIRRPPNSRTHDYDANLHMHLRPYMCKAGGKLVVVPRKQPLYLNKQACFPRRMNDGTNATATTTNLQQRSTDEQRLTNILFVIQCNWTSGKYSRCWIPSTGHKIVLSPDQKQRCDKLFMYQVRTWKEKKNYTRLYKICPILILGWFQKVCTVLYTFYYNQFGNCVRSRCMRVLRNLLKSNWKTKVLFGTILLGNSRKKVIEMFLTAVKNATLIICTSKQ